MSHTLHCSTLFCRLKLFSIKILRREFSNTRNSIILGIETSCDDTGCGVVNVQGHVLGESLYSQNAIHIRYGGVNPLHARELHRDNIELAVNNALKNSCLDIHKVDAIAVTIKPGLMFSLMVGVKYANFLAKKFHKPLISIHHMEAHALVARMFYNIPFPYLTLLISGGHCLLAVVIDVDNFLLLGQSLDNAPGEVMDKAARRMKLRNISEYSTVSGGRAIELAAKKANGPLMFQFPVPLQRNRDCNFSFSGLKDSLVQKLIKKESEHGLLGDEIIPEVNELCASFQISIAKHLAHRLARAIKFCEIKNLLCKDARNIVLSGGVACNDYIYFILKNITEQLGYNLYRPPHKVCTDNGVMIAWNGIEKLKKGYSTMSQIPLKDVDPDATLGLNIMDKVREANLSVKTPNFKKEDYVILF